MSEESIGSLLEKLLQLPAEQDLLVRKSKDGLYTAVTVQNAEDRAGEYPFITVNLEESCRKHNLILIPKIVQGFFPGYREQFVLLTDIKPFVMHLTSGSSHSKKGSIEGGYLCHPNPKDVEPEFLREVQDAGHRTEGCFGRWYDCHPEAQVGNKCRIYRINRRVYSLKEVS